MDDENNLFWYDTDCAASGTFPMLSTLMIGAATFNETDFSNNRIFTSLENTQMTWQYFRTAPVGFKDNVITIEKRLLLKRWLTLKENILLNRNIKV